MLTDLERKGDRTERRRRRVKHGIERDMRKGEKRV